MPTKSKLFVRSVVCLHAFCGIAAAEETFSRTLLSVTGQFIAPESRQGNKPRGISGLACAQPTPDGARECLTINDEELGGEVAILDGDTLTPTPQTIDIVREGDDGADIRGTLHVPGCPDKRTKYGEVDGEGAAIADGFVYVASSHSCSGEGKYKPSSYLLSRVRMASETQFVARDAPADTPQKAERSWRLADALLASDVKDAFGKKKDDGTNVEGIAVADGLLYAGLRTPPLDGNAVVITAPVSGLFAPGDGVLDPARVRTYRVPLGEGAGIRDMATLSGDGLLILSGPTRIQTDVPYRLWLADRTKLAVPPLLLATLPDARTDAGNPRGKGYGGDMLKPEAVAVLSQDDARLTVLIMHDNIDEGWPVRLEITLPKR